MLVQAVACAERVARLSLGELAGQKETEAREAADAPTSPQLSQLEKPR